MAYTTINKSKDHFNTVTFTGTNGSGQSITGVGFQPDWLWIKHRTDVSTHRIQDAVRGSTKIIASNSVTSFDSDGFTHGTNSAIDSTGNVVAWNWKAANSAGSSNTDGTITSTVSANTTAGFSIVTYTSNGSASQTVGHGLGVTPNVIISKNRTDGGSTYGKWVVYHSSLATANDKKLLLNDTAAASSTNEWGDTDPTTTKYYVHTSGDGSTNHSTDNILAYCFAEKTGYSKFGSYTGNGNANGTFVYTGFKPAWVMGKRTDTTNNWYIFDSVRDPHNLTQRYIRPDTTAAEINNSSKAIDIYSNGFKIKNSDAEFNASGGTYIYMAFGQSLVGSNNVPCTAR